jgi:hypothetical protein
MPPFTTDDETKKALAALGAGPAAAELYRDLLQPAAKELGNNLHAVAKLITAALSPLHAMVWGIDKVRDWLSVALLKRMAFVPPEDIQPPKPYIAGQILLQLPFCAEQDQLRELYANLLAAAMDRRHAGTAHPAFVHVIQQLTPDEARLLLQVAEMPSFAMSEETSDHRSLLRGSYISEQFYELCERAEVRNLDQSDGYLDNLIRLRLLTETPWNEGVFHPPGAYEHGDYGAFVENKTGRTVELSAFGKKFLETCVRNRPRLKYGGV